MVEFEAFEKNLAALRARMAAACLSVGRATDAVKLLPVTKNHPAEAVRFAARCGLEAVGENRVQEAVEKRAGLEGLVRWELIGHLQSNKAKLAVEHFDRIQSVDSLKLIGRLDRFAAEAGKKLPVLLQFNTGEDPKKFGFRMDEAGQAFEHALACEHLVLEGLMTVAPLDEGTDTRTAFDRLRELRDDLAARFGVPLPELSMGMTDDLEEAIAAGSTQIRVGTALYGQRV